MEIISNKTIRHNIITITRVFYLYSIIGVIIKNENILYKYLHTSKDTQVSKYLLIYK